MDEDGRNQRPDLKIKNKKQNNTDLPLSNSSHLFLQITNYRWWLKWDQMFVFWFFFFNSCLTTKSLWAEGEGEISPSRSPPGQDPQPLCRLWFREKWSLSLGLAPAHLLMKLSWSLIAPPSHKCHTAGFQATESWAELPAGGAGSWGGSPAWWPPASSTCWVSALTNPCPFWVLDF